MIEVLTDKEIMQRIAELTTELENRATGKKQPILLVRIDNTKEAESPLVGFMGGTELQIVSMLAFMLSRIIGSNPKAMMPFNRCLLTYLKMARDEN